MRPLPVAAALLLWAFTANAQDALTIGTDNAPTGGSAQVPVYILDRSGTPLGSDATAIGGFAFKVLFDADVVSSVSFARAGVAASTATLFETSLQGEGWISVVVTFSQPLTLTLNATSPGNQIGTLTVAATDTTPLRLDPPSVALSNQAGTVTETVASNLSIAYGSVIASGPPPAFTDDPLVPGTTVVKLVHITELRAAVNAMRATAGLPVMTADGTIASGAVVRAQHLTDLRTALNEARAVLGLSPVAFTDSPPVIIKALHVEELRDGVQ
jgi:hypothetical protein